MGKRFFLLWLLFCFANFSFAQRNVILIIADDLSPDFFGFYEGYGDTVDVPNIRALAQKGVRFKNGMTNPVCSSTRSAILTGRYGFRTGVGGIVGGSGGSGQLDTAEQTIPKLLKSFNGNISKANIGKWHLHNPSPAALFYPNKMGYDHFEGPFIGQLPSFTNWSKIINGTTVSITNYATTENIDNAITWIKGQGSKPFFLWLAFNAPHEPLQLPPSGLHSFTTLTGTAQDIKNKPKTYFKAMIQAMDHEIGRLFDTLRTANKFDSTDIIFIGDNGSTPRTAQTADTSKAKGTVYQYGVRTPFIASGPSIVNPGRASDALVNTADIFATVLEMFGFQNWANSIPTNKPVDSRSFMNVLRNEKSATRAWSFCEIFKLVDDSDEAKAMRNADYKLIRFDSGSEEFYRLSADANEANNLLKGSMTNTDSANYIFLCNEMTNLVGTGATCKKMDVPTSIDVFESNVIVSPNPFNRFIQLKHVPSGTYAELIDISGSVVYRGERIEEADFSNLPHGMYYLKLHIEPSRIIKLIKE